MEMQEEEIEQPDSSTETKYMPCHGCWRSVQVLDEAVDSDNVMRYKLANCVCKFGERW